ncbi:MAG: alpha/beta fold hydrolase [Candidatus Dormibacteraceae bacterium]
MHVKLNGAQIHYERAGSGHPVIFLHEGIADSRMWEPQVAAMAEHFDVICPDSRGFGKSELPLMEWSPVDDLLALIDELGLKPAHLVGASMGSALAIDFALDHPARIAKLVLVGSGIGGADFGQKYPHLFDDIRAAGEARDLERMNQAEIRLFVDGPNRAPGYVSDPGIRELVHDMNDRALLSDFDSAPTRDLDPPAVGRLGEINASTLVVVGDSDVPMVFDATDLLMDSLPNARKAVMHDAAHMPNLEHPEEFNRLVLDFLLDR